MGRADRLAIDGGVPGITLMEHAGAGVARAIAQVWAQRPVAVLCGPGNNGGDGFVIARHLAEAGWPVRVGLLGPRDKLAGDAAEAAARWDGPVDALDGSVLDGAGLAVDALFGAGLSRPVDGVAAAVLSAAADRGIELAAVDMPSGIHGDTGAVWGSAVPARLTVTFFRKKPGHLLMPGRSFCGQTRVVDIGIPPSVLNTIGPLASENDPDLWGCALPWPQPAGHKYARGHALVWAGAMAGAARLVAGAARRVGAGLVTVVPPDGAGPLFAGEGAGTIIARRSDWAAMLADDRYNAGAIGPGAGTGEETRAAVLAAKAAGKALVVDADGLTAFAGDSETLFQALDADDVMTPHGGEFARLFGTGGGDKLSRTRAAAVSAGAVVLHKGPDTVIAAPDGRVRIEAGGPPSLATAGSGDVLAGLILGLRAQGMTGFDAASAAAFLHSAAARAFGPGLAAEDVIRLLPGCLADLAKRFGRSQGGNPTRSEADRRP